MPEPQAYVTVVVAWAPRQLLQTQVNWTPDLTVSAALGLALQTELSAEVRERVQAQLASLQASVWGKRVRADEGLQALDRLEFTRPLRVDPKIARRERFHKQGSRGTGLFALKHK